VHAHDVTACNIEGTRHPNHTDKGYCIWGKQPTFERGGCNKCAENSKAVTTDAFGSFEYEVAKNDVLSISAKGFETKYITITKAISQISLTPEKTRDLIHAAFREVEKQDLLGELLRSM
jgi:hypothetical protein